MKKLLIYDDNKKIVDVLTQYALQEGYSVDHAFNGVEALLKAGQTCFDAILLDVMLPDIDGYEVCRRIRKTSQVPIIMVTALGEDTERIMGLDLGADDYVPKPFSPSEVMARLRAILRRVAFFEETVSAPLVRGSLKMDPDTFQVYVSGERVELTKKAFEILWLLTSHPEIVFSRTQILDKVWGYDYLGDARTQVQDSTEIGSLARETDLLAVKLAEAQKKTANRAKEQKEFFATISHELRTPVAVICSYSAALKDGILPEDRLHEYYDQLFSESLSLQRLVNDMLELSRLESSDFSIEMEPVDIGMILEDSVRSTSMLASRKQVKIIYNSPGEEMMTNGDYGRLKQMFVIVLDNALKYSESGTNIRIDAQKTNNRYKVSIQDEGPGLTEEEQRLVFQRFYSTSDNGSGLGLAIMTNIARRHGIEVSLRSAPGKGTVITFLFEAAEACENS